MSLEKKEIVIDAVSKDTHGIKVGENWYNEFKDLNGEAKSNVVSMIDQVGKGDKIVLEVNEQNKYYSITMIEKGVASQDTTNLRDLLDKAHKIGLRSITTEMVEINVKEKYALFKARVVIAKKDSDTSGYHVFESYGDALSYNVGTDGDATKKVKDSWIRMAESRAIVRALRWATNDARCAVEELDDNEPSETSEEEVKTNEEIKEEQEKLK